MSGAVLLLLLLCCLSVSQAISVDVDGGLSRAERFEMLRTIAKSPLKGWNSFDSFLVCGDTEGSANESVVRGHIDFIAEKLAPFGYRVVCMDAGWYSSSSSSIAYLDAFGRPQVDPVRYPSAVGQQGFKQLAAYAHSRGLLLGIHTMRGAHVQAVALKLPVLGLPQYTVDQIIDPNGACPWWGDFYSLNMSHPGAQAFYNSLYSQYAEWGIDFIKMDCAFAVNAVLDDVRGVSDAIFASGREMLFSLSPGKWAAPDQVEAVMGIANMYRITDDAWDDWSHLQDHVVSSVVSLHRYIGFPNGRYGLPSFPDLDMLPLGWIGEPGVSSEPYHLSWLSADEQLTLVSYWTMWRAPLIMGGDLLKPDPLSLSLITNPRALQITDHSVNNAPVSADASLAVWRADSDDWQRDGVSFVSVHNLQNASAVIGITVAAARRPTQSGAVCLVQDVWTGEMLGSRGQMFINLRRHASVLYRLYDCTDSAGTAEEEEPQ